MDKIIDNPDEKRLRKDLQACMINLSPFADSYSWKKAQIEARRLIDAPERLKALIEETRTMFSERANELQEATADLEEIWKTTERVLTQGSRKTPEDVRAVAALVYLHNPFDEKFDGLLNHGLTDDVKIIRKRFREG